MIKSIDEYIQESLPESEDYSVEHEWIAMTPSMHRRERFVLVSFSSSLEDIYNRPTVPTMLDGSSDTIVYYCTEEREDTTEDWEQRPNQYGEIWEIHNQRPS
jgi:hypothetical protein